MGLFFIFDMVSPPPPRQMPDNVTPGYPFAIDIRRLITSQLSAWTGMSKNKVTESAAPSSICGTTC
ncbi:hypothetical protein C1J05_11445 [Sulfitobacter sp. JL08]|nr:hypothetical protein C1J05_11445 [Sulfitobacter sp. JL08]